MKFLSFICLIFLSCFAFAQDYNPYLTCEEQILQFANNLPNASEQKFVMQDIYYHTQISFRNAANPEIQDFDLKGKMPALRMPNYKNVYSEIIFIAKNSRSIFNLGPKQCKMADIAIVTRSLDGSFISMSLVSQLMPKQNN